MACGILVPQPGIKPMPPAVETQVIITGPRRNFPESVLSSKAHWKYEEFLFWVHLDLGSSVQFSRSVMSDSLRPYGFAACQASPSITNSQSLLKLMSFESVMPSNCLILCCPLLLLPSMFPRIRVFSNESVLHIRWPKFCSFSFSISPLIFVHDFCFDCLP